MIAVLPHCHIVSCRLAIGAGNRVIACGAQLVACIKLHRGQEMGREWAYYEQNTI